MKQLRPTHECEQMNVVYAALRDASLDQLKKLYRVAFSELMSSRPHSDEERHLELFLHQLRVEGERRSQRCAAD